jgi:hypothetical protein
VCTALRQHDNASTPPQGCHALKINQNTLWNGDPRSVHVISEGSINFIVACVQLAGSLRFGICCMEDGQTPHFA